MFLENGTNESICRAETEMQTWRTDVDMGGTGKVRVGQIESSTNIYTYIGTSL